MALLLLYPLSAILVSTYLAPGSYSILAPLLAANAGTALFAGLTFDLPEFSPRTSRWLRLVVVSTGVVSGLLSALYWLAGEMDHIWLRAGIISPILVIFLVLMWFVRKVNKEGTKHEGE